MLLALAAALVACGAAAAAVFAGWVVHVVDDAPTLDQLRPRPQPAVTTVYGSDGSRLGFIAGDVLRLPLYGRGVTAETKAATIAIEDRRFYHHGGIDYVGVARAALKNLVSEQTVQGGSTLTMQLVRNLYLPGSGANRTLERKIREAALADQLDREHTKGWILDRYLDNVPYGTVGGQTAVGIGAAARVFFDRPADRLTLPQAALLAGLPQAPTLDNPFLHPRRAKARRAEVLAAMVRNGDVTATQAERAGRAPLGVRRNDFFGARSEPYVVDYVARELRARYKPAVLRRGGLSVHTTIDPRLQALGRQAIADHLGQPGQPQAALASVDPSDGAIRALVSSTTYGETQFDYATSAHRQPGSTFKAIDLMDAVRRGVDPDTTYYDSHELGAGWLPTEPTWSVQTDDGVYHGSISLSEAIALSDNTVYAQLGADLGADSVRQTAYDMGVTSHLDAFPAESIGGLRTGVTPLEMADAYATIADGGWRNRVSAIASVELPDGRVDRRAPVRRQEFTDGQAAKVVGALKGVLDHGTAAGMGIGCPAAGKTGTTSSFTDAWFDGFTPGLSTAVWVGYPDETTSMGAVPGYGEVFGATIPAPIWQEYMRSAIGSACDDFPAPQTPFSASPFDGAHQTAAGAGGVTSDGTTTGGTGTTPSGSAPSP